MILLRFFNSIDYIYVPPGTKGLINVIAGGTGSEAIPVGITKRNRSFHDRGFQRKLRFRFATELRSVSTGGTFGTIGDAVSEIHPHLDSLMDYPEGRQ